MDSLNIDLCGPYSATHFIILLVIILFFQKNEKIENLIYSKIRNYYNQLKMSKQQIIISEHGF